MKAITRVLALALCAGLALCLPGCQEKEAPSSSSAASAAQSAVESAPAATPTPTPAPTPTPTPAPTASPAAESAAPAGDFDAAFAQNPIYAQLEADLELASSNALIQQAYDKAAKSWQTVIVTAYEESQQVCSQDVAEQVRQEQEDWENTLDEEIQTIRSDYGNDATVYAPVVLELYRQRAEDLCRAVFEATGELPAFPEAGAQPAG